MPFRIGAAARRRGRTPANSFASPVRDEKGEVPGIPPTSPGSPCSAVTAKNLESWEETIRADAYYELDLTTERDWLVSEAHTHGKKKSVALTHLHARQQQHADMKRVEAVAATRLQAQQRRRAAKAHVDEIRRRRAEMAWAEENRPQTSASDDDSNNSEKDAASLSPLDLGAITAFGNVDCGSFDLSAFGSTFETLLINVLASVRIQAFLRRIAAKVCVEEMRRLREAARAAQPTAADEAGESARRADAELTAQHEADAKARAAFTRDVVNASFRKAETTAADQRAVELKAATDARAVTDAARREREEAEEEAKTRADAKAAQEAAAAARRAAEAEEAEAKRQREERQLTEERRSGYAVVFFEGIAAEARS